MLEYNIQINNGTEAFGTTGKTITVNENARLVSLDFLVAEVKHKNELVPERAIKDVLTSFTEVAARLMAEGFIVPLMTDKQEVIARLYADVHLKSGNINLTKARELMPDDVTDEASMVAHAGDLVSRVGIRITAHTETEQKFNDLMMSFGPKLVLKGIVEKAYVEKKDNENNTANATANGTGHGNGDGGENGNGNESENGSANENENENGNGNGDGGGSNGGGNDVN